MRNVKLLIFAAAAVAALFFSVFAAGYTLHERDTRQDEDRQLQQRLNSDNQRIVFLDGRLKRVEENSRKQYVTYCNGCDAEWFSEKPTRRPFCGCPLCLPAQEK